MTPEQFGQRLADIGWTVGTFAQRLGCTLALAQDWRWGSKPMPPEVEDWINRLATLHRFNPPPSGSFVTKRRMVAA